MAMEVPRNGGANDNSGGKKKKKNSGRANDSGAGDR